MITYKQQFDKLTEAYIRGEVNPMRGCACFVGNLLNRQSGWIFGGDKGFECVKIESEGIYTYDEVKWLEAIFMRTINTEALGGCSRIDRLVRCKENLDEELEDALFAGFEAALAELKKIHESKGEIIDNPPIFVKRKLVSNV